MAQKYLDLRSDFAFKRIFGSENNKANLIALLNDILLELVRESSVRQRKRAICGLDKEKSTGLAALRRAFLTKYSPKVLLF